jgi:hypothetical protein
MSEAGVGSMDKIDPHGLGQYIAPAGLWSTLLAVFGLIPTIIGTLGGTVALIYYCVQLWETETVQHFLKNRKARALARKVAELEYAQTQIIGKLKSLGVLAHAETTISNDTNKKTSTTVDISQKPTP